MTERLASSVVVSAILRLAERDGGFGTVLARGDENAGAIALVLAERGKAEQVLERVLQSTGEYGWSRTFEGVQNAAELERFLEKRRRFDPDMWILELDIASAERFAAELRAFD